MSRFHTKRTRLLTSSGFSAHVFLSCRAPVDLDRDLRIVEIVLARADHPKVHEEQRDRKTVASAWLQKTAVKLIAKNGLQSIALNPAIG
jgi:hypothetical protein